MKLLFLITARGGSKGLPRKNVLPLGCKPLLHWSIAYARLFARDEDICLSTDDDEIMACAAAAGLAVPFRRPAELASDSAGSEGVLRHALEEMEKLRGCRYAGVVLLQPTSPFRRRSDFAELLRLHQFDGADLAVTLREPAHNPLQVGWLRRDDGTLQRLAEHSAWDRQSLPPVFEFNGALYLFSRELLERGWMNQARRLLARTMPAANSVDIDTRLDLDWAEFLLQKKAVDLDWSF
ncbi:MAG: hypothetical protein RL095_2285 [Verrucomicrobiota bacterium]|jgi:N-acylneuraminate cytidylyltransferase